MASPTVLMVNWRDTRHPEGGGSERYIERIAGGLVARGYRVTILCPRHANAPDGESVDGVRFVRHGNKITVYLWALWTVLVSRADVVVDVQNGMPFLSCLVARCPVVVLVHHLHRQQWYSSFGRRLGRLGWWLESRLAPLVYRRCRYVTVSENTRAELARLGVAEARVVVVPNGLEPVPEIAVPRSDQPLLVAVSRLVPHKRLEHAIETVARLGTRWPELRLEVIGRGPWLDRLRRHAEEFGVADRIALRGWVDEPGKHETLARSWVHLCPSVKEGWGISIMEAAAHGVPSVAYRSAGGVCESILHGATGLLADDDLDDFVARVEYLLTRRDARTAMGEAGRSYVRGFDWDRSIAAFEEIVAGAVANSGRRRLLPRRRPATRPVEPADLPAQQIPVQRSRADGSRHAGAQAR